MPSFLIGRRELTKGLDLGRACFSALIRLSRRSEQTDCSKCCSRRLRFVAQWINMEHYFSAVDNEVYGSGSKIYHNVVGRLGIMSGPMEPILGLDWQDRPS